MQGFQYKKLGGWLAIASMGLGIFLWLSLMISPVRSSLQQSPSVAVFNEVWQKVNDNFYDPKLNGVNWKAIREKYEPSVKQTQSIDAAAVVINQMLSELKTSHTRFYTQSEPAYYQLLGIFKANQWPEKQRKLLPHGGNLEYVGIGIFTKEINHKTFINAILDGSPAAKAGLQVGDQILAVNDKPYQPIQSFINKADQAVKVSIQRTPDSNSLRTISVTPKRLNPNQMFLDAMQASIQLIEPNSRPEGAGDRRKIGYVHVWSYAGDQYQQLLSDQLIYGKLNQADGLILDLRDGWGGATPDYLNIFTAKGPTLTQVGRRGKSTTAYQWKKPVVMVVNQGSRSGKEILAYGFKRYGIGTVIGSKTAGAVVGGSPFLLQDGSLLYLAVADVFVDGERLEGKGVTPDVEVPFQLEYAQGKDPQKARAVEVLATAIKR